MSTTKSNCCELCDNDKQTLRLAIAVPYCLNKNCPCHLVEAYSKTDHSHCWEYPDELNEYSHPPCGQKIEHYKCCLCEMLNPKIQEERNTLIDELVDAGNKFINEHDHNVECISREDGYGHLFRDCSAHCQFNGFKRGVLDFLSLLQSKKK